VVELLGGRPLEGDDVAALWVDAGHDVLDRAVLARRVERLEHDEQRVGVGRVEQLLGRGELLFELLEILLGEVLRAGRVLRIQPAGLRHLVLRCSEVRRFAGGDHEIVDDLRCAASPACLRDDLPGSSNRAGPVDRWPVDGRPLTSSMSPRAARRVAHRARCTSRTGDDRPCRACRCRCARSPGRRRSRCCRGRRDRPRSLSVWNGATVDLAPICGEPYRAGIACLRSAGDTSTRRCRCWLSSAGSRMR
jgi:hypothetical protein